MELREQVNQLTDMNTVLGKYSQRLFYPYQSSMLLKVPQATDHHKYLLRTLIDQKEWVDELMNKGWIDSKLGIIEPSTNFSEPRFRIQFRISIRTSYSSLIL